MNPLCASWWLQRGRPTRSLPEHGRERPQRVRYWSGNRLEQSVTARMPLPPPPHLPPHHPVFLSPKVSWWRPLLVAPIATLPPRTVYCRCAFPLPPSSSGLGHHPFKVEIACSNPAG